MTLTEMINSLPVQITGLTTVNYIVITGLKTHMHARKAHRYELNMNYTERMKHSLKRRVKEADIYYCTAALTTLELALKYASG